MTLPFWSSRASGSSLVSSLLESPDFDAQVDELTASLQRDRRAVAGEVAECYRELSATHDPRFVDSWHRLGNWMLRGYDRLLDEEGLAGLRALDREHSLVFLVSHRSYLDEWAIPPALVEQGVHQPFGFAGANLDFFPLGSVARRTGMVHIRRSTSDQPVYKSALRSFMRHLVGSRSNLIWSIEGGRTRTGKLRPPRLGLLRYVVDAVDELDSANVLLVPVSILYDQLPTHEIGLMTDEARGQGKKPEDLKWFLGYLRGLRTRLGRVYVDFGDPIPLRSRLAELRTEGSAESTAVERIAVEVSHGINMATPVMPTAAVCIALLAADRALTLDEVLTTIEPLAAYLESRRWPTAGAANLTDRATVRRALQDLVKSGVLTSFKGDTTVWGVGPKQHLVAAVYRNSAIHVLVERSILELVLLRAAEDGADAALDPLDDAFRMRDLLKFEFFFPPREQFAANLRAELELTDPEAGIAFEDLGATDAADRLTRFDGFTAAPLMLRPFIDAYSVVAHQLSQLGESGDFDEERFLDRCLVVGQQWALQREIASEESASGEMFMTALRLARHLGLVESDAPDLAERRAAFEREIVGIRDRIERLARLGSPAPLTPTISRRPIPTLNGAYAARDR
ncbi:acyltransferase [Nocardioides immobilis]|uniref:Acyltransferase n=1 Tax=Nocardioides immobilis TaxID=2049295 RepID=A0A417Y725_9ACTN|nr:1-acyl-sn-glycerol-3-phosphate acyltransferase [Nocardioides immobilis]RHW28500.1 acyltransferase [Nocardioides immobilis]